MDTNARRRGDTMGDNAREVYRTSVDPDDSVSIATVDLVSKALDRDPLDMPPLQHQIDMDALESLFRVDGDPTRGYVEFNYVGCEVRIFANRRIVVKPA